MQEGLGFSLGAGIRDCPSPRCAGFLPSQVPSGGFSLLFLPHSLVEPQLRPGDAGGSSDPSPTGHGSCHQHRCAPPGKGSLRPAAGLGPAHGIAMEGKDLPAGRAGQSRASLLRERPAGQEHARICDPGAPLRLQEAWSWLFGTGRGAAWFPQQFPSQPSCRRTLERRHPKGSLSMLLSLSSWAAWAAENLCVCPGPPWGGLGFGCGSRAQRAQGEENGEHHFFSVPLNTDATFSKTDLVPTAL